MLQKLSKEFTIIEFYDYFWNFSEKCNQINTVCFVLILLTAIDTPTICSKPKLSLQSLSQLKNVRTVTNQTKSLARVLPQHVPLRASDNCVSQMVIYLSTYRCCVDIKTYEVCDYSSQSENDYTLFI